MAQRITDLMTQLVSMIATAFRRWSNADYGLPITMTNAIAVPQSATVQLSVTVPVDCFVRGIYPVVCAPAAPQTVDDEMFVAGITIAGFSLWDCQAVIAPVLSSANPNQPLSANQISGYPGGFKLRQGDVVTVSFTNGPTAAGRGSVFIDAYRCDSLRPAG